jgi:hypothetical protein
MMNDAIGGDEMSELVYINDSAEPVTVSDVGVALAEKFESLGLVSIRWQDRAALVGTVHMTTDGVELLEKARAA